MLSPKGAMAQRQGQQSFKGSNRISSTKFSASFVNRSQFRRSHITAKIQSSQKLSKPTTSLHTSKRHLNRNISRYKMSSSSSPKNPLKRKREEDEGPFAPLKRLNVDPTGLENLPILENITARSLSTTATSRQIDLYTRRKKAVDALRAKKARVKDVQGDWTSMPPSAQKGLSNLTGVICYRLSLLQALLHLPRFVNWLQNQHKPEQCVSDDQDRCVSCCLRSFALEYWNGTPGGTMKVLRGMHVLFKSLGWASDTASGHADPEEMALWIFGRIEHEVPSEFWYSLESKTHLSMTSVVTCARCGHESKTSGHQDTTLSLPLLPKQRSTTQYLHQYMVEEVSDYKCSACNEKFDALRKQVINFAPSNLTVTLKRFDFLGRKINTQIAIPRYLDVSRYQQDDCNESLTYELVGVIKHRGSAEGGHYIAFAKAGDGQWCGFNDERKSTSTFTDAIGHDDRFTPYMLYYQRTDV